MLTENEIAIQIYLHERESELGSFILRVREATILNKAACIEHKINVIGAFIVTSQEELFAGFFNNEKALIAEMSILELRAHREELAKIAFEARARLTAVDDEERARKAKNQREGRKELGFSTSLTTDEVTSDAINKVKQRQAKMTKVEKTIEGLVKMGMERKEAEKMVSAGTLLARIKEKAKAPVSNEPVVPVVNPFAKPAPTTELATDVTIVEETNTVIVKTEEPASTEPKPFNNPFAK